MYDINEMKTPFLPRMIDYDSDIEAYCRLASRCISNADRLYVYIIANILQVYVVQFVHPMFISSNIYFFHIYMQTRTSLMILYIYSKITNIIFSTIILYDIAVYF